MAPIALADLNEPSSRADGIAAPAVRKPSYRIASIPADGIGPEVIDAGIAVLKAVAKKRGTFELDFDHLDWSSDRYKRTGTYLPDNHLEILRAYDAILCVPPFSESSKHKQLTRPSSSSSRSRSFGAVGAPDVPDHISLWGLRLAIAQPLQQYANVRCVPPFSPHLVAPRRSDPSLTFSPCLAAALASFQAPPRRSPTARRACSTGSSSAKTRRASTPGREAARTSATTTRWRPVRSLLLLSLPFSSLLEADQLDELAEVSIFTRHSVRRIARFAFQLAASRPRKMLTFVTKSNAQRSGMVMWDEVMFEVAKDFPNVTLDHMLGPSTSSPSSSSAG